jgi:hypothetical protein
MAACALALASAVGVTGAIAQRGPETKGCPRGQIGAPPNCRPPVKPQVQGPNLFVKCSLAAANQRLLPGTAARRTFMQRCQGL